MTLLDVQTPARALALIDAAFIFGTGRRCLHDMLAGTKVIAIRS